MNTDQTFIEPSKEESSENSDYASSSEEGETGTSSSSPGDDSSISSYSSDDEISNREILSTRSLTPMDIDIPAKTTSMNTKIIYNEKNKKKKIILISKSIIWLIYSINH